MIISQKEWDKLQVDLQEAREEIELLKEDHQKKLDALTQQHTQALEESAATLEAAKAEIETLTEQLQAAKKDLSRLRGANTDVNQYRQYNQRLVQPITVEDVKKVYPDHLVTATPAFFQLVGEHNLTWLLLRGEIRRRSNGYLPNLLDSPPYLTYFEDKLLQSQLPGDLKSTVDMIFVRQREARVFALCEPCVASQVVLSFLAEPTAAFQDWCSAHSKEILVNVGSTQHPEWRLIYIILSFPCQDNALQLLPDNTEDNSTMADLLLLQERQAQHVRETYQCLYRQHIFGGQRSSGSQSDVTAEEKATNS